MTTDINSPGDQSLSPAEEMILIPPSIHMVSVVNLPLASINPKPRLITDQLETISYTHCLTEKRCILSECKYYLP